MQNYKSNYDIKRLARMSMSGNLGTLIGALLLIGLIIGVCTVFGSIIPASVYISSSNKKLGIILFYIVMIFVDLIKGVLLLGYCLICLRVACNIPCKIRDIFYCFRYKPSRAITIQLIFTLLSKICTLPSNIFYYRVISPVLGSAMAMDMTINDLLGMIYSEDFITSMSTVSEFNYVGLLIYFLITIPLIPTCYLLFDFYDYSVKDILVKSWSLMKNNMFRYCRLIFLFIPVLFLSYLTYGIGFIITIPYLYMGKTIFYLDMMSVNNRSMAAENQNNIYK